MLIDLREGKGGKEGGKERAVWERNINGSLLISVPGMCPDQELNP